MKLNALLIFIVFSSWSSVSLASDAICSISKGTTVVEKDHKFPYDQTFEVKDIMDITIADCKGNKCTIKVSTDSGDYQYNYVKGMSSQKYGIDGYRIVCKDSDFVAADEGAKKIGKQVKDAVKDIENKLKK